MGDGRFVACWVIKMQNKLKYNFSGRVSLLQVATVTGISTKGPITWRISARAEISARLAGLRFHLGLLNKSS